MKITILGTGIVGRTIAVRLADLGHEITIGTRNVESTLKREEKDGSMAILHLKRGIKNIKRSN